MQNGFPAILGNFWGFWVDSGASLKHSETIPARSSDARQRLPSALRWSSNAPGDFRVTLRRRRSGEGCYWAAQERHFGVILGTYRCGKCSSVSYSTHVQLAPPSSKLGSCSRSTSRGTVLRNQAIAVYGKTGLTDMASCCRCTASTRGLAIRLIGSSGLKLLEHTHTDQTPKNAILAKITPQTDERQRHSTAFQPFRNE